MSIKSDRWIRRMAREHGMIEPFTEAQVRQLAAIGQRIHDAYGSPQDIEWAFAGGDLYLLRLDASRFERLTRTEAEESLPELSPDGRRVAVEQFTTDRIIPQYLDYYREVIEAFDPGCREPEIRYVR